VSKKVILSADSCCDLNEELLRRYEVNRIHPTILLEGKEYTDCVDIFPEDLYKAYWERGVMPKTTAINTGEYLDYFRKWTEQGYEVVHLCIGSGFSACYQYCRLAAEELGGVYPVDTRNLSGGVGLLTVEAGKRIAEGKPAGQVAEEVTELTSKVQCSFILDTLDFMRAGGRCSSVAALGANILKLKPTIIVNNRESTMEVGKKYRGNLDKVLLQYAGDRLSNFDRIKEDLVLITHSGSCDENLKLVSDFLRERALFREIQITRASCMISCHCGPETLGVLFMTE